MTRRIAQLILGIVIILGFVRASAAQEKKEIVSKEEPAAEFYSEIQNGPVEFGVRTFWGNVFGRPDLPFLPKLSTSKLNEYSDIRNNLFVRRANVYVDDVFGTHNYVRYRSQSNFYRNQSHLATLGQYGRYEAEVRYDEIPHIFSNTTRTLYGETRPGVFTLPLAIRQSLQTTSSTGTAAQINNSLPSFIATQIVPNEPFVTPRLQRRAGGGVLGYRITPDLNVAFAVAREHAEGTRPIGAILNSSPTAAGSS